MNTGAEDSTFFGTVVRQRQRKYKYFMSAAVLICVVHRSVKLLKLLAVTGYKSSMNLIINLNSVSIH
jgi:hypothetical protein